MRDLADEVITVTTARAEELFDDLVDTLEKEGDPIGVACSLLIQLTRFVAEVGTIAKEPARDSKGRLKITAAGRDYLIVIREALDHIGAGTERLMQRRNASVLTVSTSLDFAAKWLVHRLARFAAAHPGIDLRVSATMHTVDFAHEDIDVAVRHSDGNWPGLEATRLCDAVDVLKLGQLAAP